MRISSFIGLAAAIASLGLLYTGCGADSTADSAEKADASITWLGPSGEIPGLSQRTVGSGADGAVLLWAEGTPPPRDAVVFLHSWLPLPPNVYGDWIRHLARQGNTVVYPVYQQGSSRSDQFLDDALAGIETGLEEISADPDSLVAIGHTTGGALAFDYASVAEGLGIPGPRAVLAVYPGRNPGDGEVPPGDLTRIPADTLLEVIAGPGDPLPDGKEQAMALLDGAIQVPASARRYREAPPPKDLRPKRSAWVAADRLIAEARGSGE